MTIERGFIPGRWQLPISRRSVLRGGGTVTKWLVAAGVLASIGLFEETEKPQPKELPNDLLSEEALKRANIKIYQTPETKLYLRESALQFPLFQDAAEGKVDETVIVLVDSPKINIDATQNLKGNAKVLLERVLKNRGETVNQYNVLGYMLSGRTLKEAEPEFVKENPQFANKVYIYLAIGGDSKPDPSQSYPNPQQFGRYKNSLLESFAYDRKLTSKSRGFVLTHEILHYNPIGDDHGELETDLMTINHIASAWKKYQETGDSNSYPFVFVTKKGITITRNLQQDRANNI